ncbi:MAG: CHASE4 domain-containing protein [Nostocaceae cyanobacterium]|nr:CHASE4 domain-containing protein [Nostocaceae cyanobacterium]
MGLLHQAHILKQEVYKATNQLDIDNMPPKGTLLMLRKKILLAVVATLTSLFGIWSATSAIILMNSIRTAEEQNTRQVVDGVLSIIAQTQADFSDRFVDWSQWNDTYEFIEKKPETSYKQSNLNPETLANMQVNLVLYINSSGQLVYGTGLDIAKQQKIPIPEAIKPQITPNSFLLRSPNNPERQKILTGLVLLPTGPMLLTSQPILTSRGTGPIAGTLIFGRYLNMRKIEQLSSRYHLTMWAINDPKMPADFRSALAAFTPEQKIFIRTANKQVICGYTIIYDIYNHPAVVLRTDVPRTIYQQGITHLRYLLISLAIVFLIFGAAAVLLLENLIREKHQHQESEARYRAVIAQASEGIFLIDAENKRFLEANAALVKLLGYSPQQLLKLTIYDVAIAKCETIDREIDKIFTTNQHVTSEQQYRRRDGKILDVEVNANYLTYGNSNVFCIVIRDITERKRTEKVLLQQAKKEQVLNRVVQAIRKSLDLQTVFSTAVSEIGKLLNVERSTICAYLPEECIWRCVAEYRQREDLPVGLGLEIPDAENPVSQRLQQREIICIDDASTHEAEIVQILAQTYPGAWLMIPLPVDSDYSAPVWGTLNLLRHSKPKSWLEWEVDLARAIADQLTIAIQQSQLYHQVKQLNTDLESQVQERTAELKTALDYEATLKLIADKVRDSLDEAQILQTAVQELGVRLQVRSCNAALYDLDNQTSTICYEYTRPQIPSLKGITCQISDFPDIYNQLLDKQYVQCCSSSIPGISLPTGEQKLTILCCPLMDDRGVLGDIWLYKPMSQSFSEVEIRLVQQVANQCAIALRQSRLYQAACAQVQELERLNHLKDDFLSTVSHELRTPMSSIKMATQMLEIVLEPSGIFDKHSHKAARYFKILQDECEREINLINDLLDLSRIDAGAETIILSTIDPHIWILHLAEPFQPRTTLQQQTLELDVPPDLPEITTDLTKLERIITELLNNACKYTPAGEKIVLTVRSHGNMLHLTVKNTGVNIPETELGRIFDKFYRIPNKNPWKHGGTGLGLALVKKLAIFLGGSIEVFSQDNSIRFDVQVPVNLSSTLGQKV